MQKATAADDQNHGPDRMALGVMHLADCGVTLDPATQLDAIIHVCCVNSQWRALTEQVERDSDPQTREEFVNAAMEILLKRELRDQILVAERGAVLGDDEEEEAPPADGGEGGSSSVSIAAPSAPSQADAADGGSTRKLG